MSAAPSLKNPLMDKEFINSFVSAAERTILLSAQIEISSMKASIETVDSLKGDVTGIVKLESSPYLGVLSISFPKDSILFIIQSMLGESHTEISSDVQDAVGELTNMIFGCAKTTLNQSGYAFKMSLPCVAVDKNYNWKTKNSPAIIIPMQIKGRGDFYIGISIS